MRDASDAEAAFDSVVMAYRAGVPVCFLHTIRSSAVVAALSQRVVFVSEASLHTPKGAVAFARRQGRHACVS